MQLGTNSIGRKGLCILWCLFRDFGLPSLMMIKFYRDIKGANLLVDAYGVVKLADFGMAKHVSLELLKYLIG